ncbi:MAG: hypothetical protein AAGF10_00160 [Verrucomicrobiota bacterium]
MDTAHILFILKTAFVTLLLILGLYTLIMSKAKFESIISRVSGSHDLELTTGNFVFLKVLGGGFVIVAILAGWFFFA